MCLLFYTVATVAAVEKPVTKPFSVQRYKICTVATVAECAFRFRVKTMVAIGNHRFLRIRISNLTPPLVILSASYCFPSKYRFCNGSNG